MSSIVSKIEIPESEITSLDEDLKKNFFKETVTLIYPGQRPLAAIYIHSGQVIVLKNNKIAEIIGPGKLIIPDEFKQKLILKVELVVAASTMISWISLDTIQKLNYGT